MRRLSSTRLAAVLLIVGSLTSEAGANTVECGANSVSYADVVSHRGQARAGRPRRGPIEVVPDSLCADLIEDRPQAIESLQLTLDPRSQPAQRSSPNPD
jgi:hypothetical protein